MFLKVSQSCALSTVCFNSTLEWKPLRPVCCGASNLARLCPSRNLKIYLYISWKGNTAYMRRREGGRRRNQNMQPNISKNFVRPSDSFKIVYYDSNPGIFPPAVRTNMMAIFALHVSIALFACLLLPKAQSRPGKRQDGAFYGMAILIAPGT